MDIPQLQSPPARPQPAAKPPLSPELAKARRVVIRNLVILGILFSLPVYHLLSFAAGSDLYSYLLLMPFVTLYLIWQLPASAVDAPFTGRKNPGWGIFFALAGAALFATYAFGLHAGWKLEVEDRLAYTTTSFLFFVTAICCLGLDRKTMGAVGFPLFLLVFMIPLPTVALDHIETFLQYGSAYVTHAMLTVAGTPFIREGLIFKYSDISIRVAPECSGIHSTWILLITSLLAGYMFLRAPWKRATLALFIVPLALLRNGFRIFTVSELCIHIGPQMIDHWIHHRGGPIFFALSLPFFFLLLLVLQKSDRRKKQAVQPPSS